MCQKNNNNKFKRPFYPCLPPSFFLLPPSFLLPSSYCCSINIRRHYSYTVRFLARIPSKVTPGPKAKILQALQDELPKISCYNLSIHDDEGAQVCSVKRGHNLFITADWSDISVDDYDCVVVPGGRSPELLVMNEKAVDLVKEFDEKNRVIAGIGQGQWLLAAAGVLKGKRCASGYGMKVMVKIAGGELEESEGCVSDGNLVTAVGWPALPSFISQLSELLSLSFEF